MMFPSFFNSVVLSGGVAVVAGVMGCLMVLAGLGRRGWARWGLGLAAVVVLAMPPFLVVNFWLRAAGDGGWLPVPMVSMLGAGWMLCLGLWPVTYFVGLGLVARTDVTLLEVEPGLRGMGVLRHLIWPQGRGALLEGVVLVFVLAWNSFTIPALCQVPVLSSGVWVSFSTRFDVGEAVLMSLPSVLGAWVVARMARTLRLGRIQDSGSAGARLMRERLGRRVTGVAGGMAWVVVGLSAVAPLVDLVLDAGTWRELVPAVRAAQAGVMTSVGVAAATACLGVGVAGLFWRRLDREWCFFPFFLPGIVLGVVLIWVLNRPLFGSVYPGMGVVLGACLIRYLVIPVRLVGEAMGGVDAGLRDEARVMGASDWVQARRLFWPEVRPALGAGWLVVYLLVLWDVETLVLIVPPGSETIALRIFNLLHYGHNLQVNALCLVLLAVAVLPLLVVGAVEWLCRGGRGGRVGVVCLGGAVVLVGGGCGRRADPQGVRLESRLFEEVRVIGTRGTGLGQFNKPRSLAVDRADNLYVVDMTGRVQKFDSEGRFLLFWQMPQTDKGKPKGMGVDGLGRVVVIEPHYSRVNHFEAEGRLSSQWGFHGTNAGQLAFPRAVAVTRGGAVFVSEYGILERIQRFDAAGATVELTVGKAGAGDGELNRAEGLGMDGADRLFVADSCNHRIQVFDRDGRWLRSHGRAGTGRGEFSYPYDVKVDGTGLQFVCEFGNSRVQVFDSRDQVVEVLGRAGTAPGEFGNPWAIALDSHGNLYVADAMNHRVQKFIRREGMALARASGGSAGGVDGRGAE